LAAAVVARGSNVVTLVACARLLPQSEFGQVAVIQSTVGMFAPIAGLGLAMTCTKFIAEYRDTDPARAGRVLGLSLATAAMAGATMTAVLIVLAPWIARQGLSSPDLARQLVAASGMLVLGVIESAQGGALTGLAAFSRLARVGAWSGAVSIPVVAGLTMRYGVQGAIGGMTVSLAISCLINAVALRAACRAHGIRATVRGSASERNLLFHFSLPSYLSGLLVAPVAWLANALLVQGANGFSQMALFSAADRFRYLLIFVPLAVSRVAVPALSRLYAAGDAQGYHRTLRWNLTVTALATAIPVLLCVAAAGPLMSLFGPMFRPGWRVLAVLALSAIPTVLNTQLGAALLSEGRAWQRAIADAVLAVGFLGLAWWAVPRWGAMGLSAAFTLAYSAACLLLFYFIWQNARVAAVKPPRTDART
jgi:O-antigen/teichoic acid export membrane protein